MALLGGRKGQEVAMEGIPDWPIYSKPSHITVPFTRPLAPAPWGLHPYRKEFGALFCSLPTAQLPVATRQGWVMLQSHALLG